MAGALSPPRHWLEAVPLAPALVGVCVAVVAVTADWRLLVPLAIGLPLAATAVVAGPKATDVPEAADEPFGHGSVLHRLPYLSATWAALIALNLLRLLSPNRAADAAASGDASLDNLLQVGATGMAVLVLVSALLRGWSRPVPRPAWLFIGFGLWAATSVLWSQTQLFTLVRGSQYLVLALFTAYTAARAATEPGFTRDLLARTLRLVTFYVGAASLWWLAEVGIDHPRVNWRGNSPNTVGAAMMLPVLGLLAHPRRAWITRPLPWWTVVSGLAVLLYLTRSRTFVGAAVLAGIALLATAGRHNARILGLGAGAMLIVTSLTMVFAWEQVLEIVFRGESSNRVTGFAGRMELWEWVFQNPAGSEVWGVGLGASRGRIPASWHPDNAHNAWVDLLQDLGVVGVGLMAAVVLAAVALVVLRRSLPGAWTLGVVVIATVTGISIGQPGWAAALLGLGIVAAVDHDARVPDLGSGWSRAGASDQEHDPGQQQQAAEGAEAGQDHRAGQG